MGKLIHNELLSQNRWFIECCQGLRVGKLAGTLEHGKAPKIIGVFFGDFFGDYSVEKWVLFTHIVQIFRTA